MQDTMLPDTRALYDAFRKAGGDRPHAGASAASPISGAELGVAIHFVTHESHHAHWLREDDRGLRENLVFDVPIFVHTEAPTRATSLVVLLHGLNESLWSKLFPWAASLSRSLHAAVALFPMALHLTRRPHDWIERGRTLFPQRASLAGNTHTSPFNAVLSERLHEAPDRFLRAGLQSCADVADFADRARMGRLPGCDRGARVDFVGYSAGGYAALALLACDADNRFASSRALLLAAGASGEGVHLESLFILDHLAGDTVRRAYAMDGGVTGHDIRALCDESRHALFLCELLAGRAGASGAIARVSDRVRAIALAGDPVIDGASMARALAPIAVETIAAGSHEYPFSIDAPLPDIYSPSAGRRLVSQVARSSDVSPSHTRAFSTFIALATAHLRAPPATGD